MQQGLFKDSSPSVKLVIAGSIAFGVFIIVFMLGAILTVPIFKISFFEFQNVLSNYHDERNLMILKYLQIVQSIGLFILPPIIIGYYFDGLSLRHFKLGTVKTIQIYVIVALIMIVAIPSINFFADLNVRLKLPDFLSSMENWMVEKEEAAKEMTIAFVKADNFKVFLFNLFLIAVLPAIGEELLFRGIFQKIFIDWTKNAFWGIFLTAFLFSFLHFQFFGFIPRLLLGMLLGYLFYWSKNIWLSIFAHFINNGLAVFVYYKFGNEFVTEKVDKVGTIDQPIYYFFFSLALVSYFLYITKNQFGRGGVNLN